MLKVNQKLQSLTIRGKALIYNKDQGREYFEDVEIDLLIHINGQDLILNEITIVELEEK